MPAGSGSLALLFKIDADTAEARAAFQQLLTAQNQLVQGVLEGMKAEAQNALNTIKNLTDQQKGVLQGIVVASTAAQKQIAEGSKAMADQVIGNFEKIGHASNQLTTIFNQGRQALEQFASGNAAQGLVSTFRAMGTAGTAAGLAAGLAVGAIVIAIGAAIVAAVALVKSFEAIVSAAQEIGTRSKDGFEELQKKVDSAGDHITELQRQLSRGIVDALDQVKGASTGFMATVIEKSAPALIGLLKEVADWLVRLKPLAADFGNVMSAVFNHINASLQTFEELAPNVEKFFLHLLFPGIVTPESKRSITEFADIYIAKLKAIEAANKAFKPGSAPFDPKKVKETKQGLEELAQAMADFDEAQRLANEERQRIAIDEAHGVIDRDQAASQLVDIEERLFQAEKKRIEAERDVALLNAKTADARAAANIKAENAIANARTQTDIKTSQLFEKRDKENQAADDKLINEAIEEDKKERKLIEDRNEFRIKSEIETQKAIAAINAEDVKAPGQTTVGQDIISDIHATTAALDPATKAWGDAKFALDQYVQSIQSGKLAFSDMPQILDKIIDGLINQTIALAMAGKGWAALSLAIKTAPLIFLDQFNKQLKKMVDTFIETGKTGPAALKQLVSATLKAIGEMASTWAMFMFSYALAMLALQQYKEAALAFAAGVGLEALALALGFAANKVAPKEGGASASAAAIAQPPNTTINVGGAGPQLGGTPGDLFGQIVSSNNNHAQAIASLNDKLDSMSAGDVVTRAASTTPQAFATGVTNATKTSASFTRSLGLTLQPT
jgi:hypothetical protein